MDAKEGDGPSRLLRRRDFLVFSSAGLLAPLFGNLAWAEGLAGSAAVAVQPMSVGFVEGSDTLHGLRRVPRKIRRPALQVEGEDNAPLRVVPAASLAQGDTSLPGRPLRIRIDGLYPAAALSPKRLWELPQAIDLDFIFPPPDPVLAPNPIRFQAWSFRRAPWDLSAPVSFHFPLEWQALPEIVLKVRDAAGTVRVLQTKFTLDEEPGRPRLLRGFYVLGLTPGAWRSDVRLDDLARKAPAELFSILISFDPEGEA
ncbi:MAG: hypothetical protein QOF89_3903 [Acidobacteriota bacterium]|jgi:hypothetical protein|nr:hypothetical protein [Acidobacteriota bacterium]